VGRVAFGKLIRPFIPDEWIVRLRPSGKQAQQRRRWEKRRKTVRFFTDSFQARLDGAESLIGEPFDPNLPLRAYQLSKIRSGQMTHRIEGWAAMGAEYGMQYAYPLLDRRLVEFALGLPPEMYVRDGWNRWLFRRAMAGILTEEIRWFTSKQDAAMSASGEKRREMVENQILPVVEKVLLAWLDEGREFHVLDRQQLRRHLTAPSPVAEEAAGRQLFPALRVEQWLNPALAEQIAQSIAEL
jgi:asparagine synthetase B (glutamine-hydrolysing)